MKIGEISIENYKSIVSITNIKLSSLQAFVGENNAGKSNILSAIDSFLSGGSGGVIESSFHESNKPIKISITFKDLNPEESKIWKKYLINNELKLIKIYSLIEDEKTGKRKVETEFHGYESEPKSTHLSIKKIEALGGRADWTKLIKDNQLPDYFLIDGKGSRSSYAKGLDRYLIENQIDFDPPDQKETHALGLKSNVVANLPKAFILPAITNFKDETDSRKTNSIFNRLMAEITERILKTDPNYNKLEQAINTITDLFNHKAIAPGGASNRFQKLDKIETAITGMVQQLMPTVNSVKLLTAAGEIKSVLAQSIEVEVNDGIATDVFAKGHGLQRCIIFSMLHALIKNENGKLLEGQASENKSSIVLLIEEPELYIHSQLRRLFFDTLEEFSRTDQVIFNTHSSDFIDLSNFYQIGIVKKENTKSGTKIHVAKPNIKLNEEKKFRIMSKINPHINEVLFSKKIILVEGGQDKIALTQGLISLGKIKKRPEEIHHSIINCGGKENIPDIQRILSAFDLPFVTIHDLDIVDGMDQHKKANHETTNLKIKESAGSNRILNFIPKLETTLKYDGHFSNDYDALSFMIEPSNHTEDFYKVVNQIFSE